MKTIKSTWLSKRKLLNLLFSFALVSLFLISGARAAEKVDEPQKESVLSRAKALMDQDEANRSNMRAVVTLLEESRIRFPDEIRIPLYLAEAYYRMADPVEKIEKTYPIFEKTEFYSQEALKMDPDRIEAHYWHGLFLLRKAQYVSMLRAYFVDKEGIAELEEVRRILPAYDHGGASRVLGLLYAKAPSWSPFGDLDRAVLLAKEATTVDPDYLLNRVYLAEVYQKRGDREAAILECHKILSVPSSRNLFEERVRSILLALK